MATRSRIWRIGLNIRPSLRKLNSMRRLIAAIALSAVVGYAAVPALVAMWCETAMSHACCARTGDGGIDAATRAPCCKTLFVTENRRTEAAPGAGIRVVAPVAVALSAAPAFEVSSALAARHRGSRRPSPPALGPPLRLRI